MSLLQAPRDDDADSLYTPESGEVSVPAPKRSYHAPGDWCSDSEALDDYLDTEDTQASPAAITQTLPRITTPPNKRSLHLDKQTSLPPHNILSTPEDSYLEVVTVVSMDDVALTTDNVAVGVSTANTKIPPLPPPPTTATTLSRSSNGQSDRVVDDDDDGVNDGDEHGESDDDKSGFASDEHVVDVDDEEDDDSDVQVSGHSNNNYANLPHRSDRPPPSADNHPAPPVNPASRMHAPQQKHRGAMTVMGIARPNNIADPSHTSDRTARGEDSTSTNHDGPNHADAANKLSSKPSLVMSRSTTELGSASVGRHLPKNPMTGADAKQLSDQAVHPERTNRDAKGPGSSNFFNNIARAGATFYKSAFKPGRLAGTTNGTSTPKGTAKPPGLAQTSSEAAFPSSEGRPMIAEYSSKAARKAIEMQAHHHRLIAMIDAQIATLNGAKAGFVDLALLRPMTERTRKLIEEQVFVLVEDFGKLEERIEALESEIVLIGKRADEEISEKEKVLIAAKLSMAEAQEDVMNLKHELAGVKKQLNDPIRVAAKAQSLLKARAASARENAVVAMDARKAAEDKLEMRKRQLEAERATAKQLEAGWKDMEGEWA